MEKQARHEVLQEHVEGDMEDEEDIKALFYHIELVQLLGKQTKDVKFAKINLAEIFSGKKRKNWN